MVLDALSHLHICGAAGGHENFLFETVISKPQGEIAFTAATATSNEDGLFQSLTPKKAETYLMGNLTGTMTNCSTFFLFFVRGTKVQPLTALGTALSNT